MKGLCLFTFGGPKSQLYEKRNQELKIANPKSEAENKKKATHQTKGLVIESYEEAATCEGHSRALMASVDHHIRAQNTPDKT